MVIMHLVQTSLAFDAANNKALLGAIIPIDAVSSVKNSIQLEDKCSNPGFSALSAPLPPRVVDAEDRVSHVPHVIRCMNF